MAGEEVTFVFLSGGSTLNSYVEASGPPPGLDPTSPQVLALFEFIIFFMETIWLAVGGPVVDHVCCRVRPRGAVLRPLFPLPKVPPSYPTHPNCQVDGS